MNAGKLVVLALALVACKGKSDGAATSGSGSAKTAERPAPPKIAGPSVSPVATAAVTFVVPKTTAWWGEMSFACYRAVMGLSATARPGDAFEKLSPNVVPAMQAAGIDLGRDLEAIGAFDCGNGSPCFYVAARIEHPDKLGEMLKALVPGAPVKDLGGGHYTLETQGTAGPRTIHLRAVPVQWSADGPDDRWSVQQRDATHVVFIGGVDGKNADVDPLTVLADPAAAAARVKNDEGVLADPHGRCILGDAGAHDFQPGFKLERARFAIAAPEGNGSDALMKMIGSKRSLDTEVELVLDPAPAPADVDGWIQKAKLYLSMIGGQVRGQFAGAGEMVDLYFDMVSLIADRAFRHELKDKALRLSWRSDRVPQSDLADLEKRFEAVMPGGVTP